MFKKNSNSELGSGFSFKNMVKYIASFLPKEKILGKSKSKVAKIKHDMEIQLYRNFFTNNKNNFKDSAWRKKNLKDVPFDEILKNGKENKIFPKCILDESQDSKIKSKIKGHQENTGIYLWSLGYDPEKCLGVGANGVVWKCGKEALKVTCDSTKFGFFKVNAVEDEKSDSSKLSKIMETPSAKDSLVSAEYDVESEKEVGGCKRGVFKSELASGGDLEHYEFDAKEYRKFLDILGCAVNTLKGLELIHKNNYSHNDVKPENLLAIGKKSQSVINKIAADGCDYSDGSVVVKVADFGAMTEIDHTTKVFANKYFYAPDVYNLSKEAVDKRDVYSLGAVLLYLLIGCPVSQAKNWASKLEKSSDVEKFCDLGSGRNLLDEYGCSDDLKRSKFLEFLKIIQKMVATSFRNRLSVWEACQAMKIVSHMGNGRLS